MNEEFLAKIAGALYEYIARGTTPAEAAELWGVSEHQRMLDDICDYVYRHALAARQLPITESTN